MQKTFDRKSPRWNIVSGIVELLLLRLIYSSCDDLQKPKVVSRLEEKQEEKRGIVTAFSSTWQVMKGGRVFNMCPVLASYHDLDQ